MLNTSGLALDQAPPIAIPLSFFLTAPLYLAAAGLLILVGGADLIASRWTPGALAVVHLTVLGFLTQIMFGALLQMLPVLAGVRVPRVAWVSPSVFLLLNLGVPLQCVGFLSVEGPWLLTGSVLVGGAVGLFLVAAAVALSGAKGDRFTVLGMRLSATALLVTAGLGLWMALGLAGFVTAKDLASVTNVHLAWGLFGWAGILVIGVSFQVLPMFYLTPEFPLPARRWLIPGILTALLLVSASMIAGIDGVWALILVVAGFLAYLVSTLRVLQQRKRSRSDVTLDYWRLGLMAMLGAMAAWFAGLSPPLIGILLLLGVGVSIPSGMLYKIVPFLSWFHLQQRQLQSGRLGVRVPHTGLLMPMRWARFQWGLHLAALVALLTVPLASGLAARVGGALLLAAAALLGWNLVRVVAKYVEVRAQLVASPQDPGNASDSEAGAGSSR